MLTKMARMAMAHDLINIVVLANRLESDASGSHKDHPYQNF
jgi:hypothetical protein